MDNAVQTITIDGQEIEYRANGFEVEILKPADLSFTKQVEVIKQIHIQNFNKGREE